MKLFFTTLPLLSFLLLIQGCTNSSLMKGNTPHSDDNISKAEHQRVALNPFYVNSDYFEKRMVQSRIETQQIESSQQEEDERSLVETIQKYSDSHSLSNQSSNIRAGLVSKIAENALNMSQLEAHLRAKQSSNTVVFVHSNRIKEVTDNTHCPPADKDCLIKELSKFPSLRFAVFINHYKTPEHLPGHAELSLQIVDTALLFYYPETKLTAAIDNVSDLSAFNEMIAQQLQQTLASYASISPFITRYFDNQQNKWYIYAGKKSGIKVGDSFAIAKDSQLILSPQKRPIGWQNKGAAGTLKVVEHVGENISVCIHTAGRKPEADDLLVLE